jgi:LacI family transcriptional regulator
VNPTFGERNSTRPKARLRDVARAAGVSVGTVDRVVNARGSVHPETEKRVLAVARSLRLDRALDLRPTRMLRLGVLTESPTVDPFYDQMIAAFRASVHHYAHLNISVSFHFFDLDRRTSILDKIDLICETCDGLVIDGFEDPAVIDRLQNLGPSFPVITIASDLPQSGRFAYAGADARAAGRVAAQLMGRFLIGRTGTILLITGLHAFTVQEQQELGFRAVIRERFPALRILQTFESFERPDLYDLIIKTFQEQPDLIGIFNLSTGNESVARALVDLGRERDTVFIITDITPAQRELLKKGIVDAILDLNEEELAWIAVEEFLVYFGRLPEKSRRSVPRFEIYLSEDC